MIFWNEVFIIAGNESLWLVQKLTGLPHQVDGIRSFVNLNCTDYNMIVRKNKLLKIKDIFEQQN